LQSPELKATRVGDEGFSLLECVVALVLISSFGMALLSWFNTTSIGFHRVLEQENRRHLEDQALEFLRSVNPMTQPEGSVPLEGYTLRWRSRVLQAPRRGAGHPTGLGEFEVALYEMRIEVSDENGHPQIIPFRLRQVGWRRIRPFNVLY